MVKRHREEDGKPSPIGEKESPVFGQTQPKKKSRSKRKKRRQWKYGDEGVRASCKRGGLDTSDERMAALRAAAKLAMEAAQRLAGEPVCWCCGVLRITSKIDYECECKKRPEVRQVNELLQE